MSDLPANTELGDLSPLTVYGYFDGPYLFSVVSSTGQHFIALAIDDTATDAVFLYVPVSPGRLAAFERGTLSPREAFARPEGRRLFRALVGKRESPGDVVERLSVDDVTDDMLPEPNAVFSPAHGITIERKRRFSIDTALREAVAAQQDLFRIALRFGNLQAFQAPLDELTEILACLQDAVNAIGQWLTGDYSDMGRIKESVLKDVSLNITGAFASSFGLDIMIPSRRNLLEPSLASSALRTLTALLEADADEELVERLQAFNKRSVTKYREFLESIVGNNVAIDGVLASAFDGFARTLSIDHARAQRALKVVTAVEQRESETAIFIGALIGLNSRNRAFEIRDQAGTVYRGRVSPDAPEPVLRSTIESIYEVTLMMTTEVSSITGEARTQNVLLNLTPPGGPPV